MDLEKQAQIVGNIHDTLAEYVGQKLRVRANMGRSKIVENEGILMQVHPQLFIVEVKRKRGVAARQSYQYVDVLTGMVELSQDGEPLFGTFIEEDEEEPPAPLEGFFSDMRPLPPDMHPITSGAFIPNIADTLRQPEGTTTEEALASDQAAPAADQAAPASEPANL